MPKGLPPLPRSKTNPVGQTRNVEKAYRAIQSRLKDIQAWLIDRFGQIEVRRVQLNSSVPGYEINQELYEYLIDVQTLNTIVTELEQQLSGLPADELVEQVIVSYEAGTGIQVATLASLTDEYTRTIATVLTSDPYQRRVAFIRARVFEQMKGFEGDTAADLARVLSEGIENGRNPRVVAETIKERFGVASSRAERIARTEITQAQRRAILDEDADANARLGIRTGVLWFSALSPTTRKTHARRHGRTYTQEEVRDFYSKDGNAINCKCSVRSVLVDEDGEPLPLNDKLLSRMADQRKDYEN